MPAAVARGMFAHLAAPGREIVTRVVPGARRVAVVPAEDGLKIWVTARADAGQANAAVRKVLARSLGIPAGRLLLVRGETARIKTWRIAG